MSSTFAAKIMGGFLCLAFLFTLKPLLRLTAAHVPAPIRGAFIFEIESLGRTSSIPGSVVLALLAGIALWVVVGIALTPLLDDLAVFVGAAAGFAVLYPYFFVLFWRRAARSQVSVTEANRAGRVG